MTARRLHAAKRGFATAIALATALCAPPAAAEREHLVRPGQSLARIARRYRTSVKAIAAANGLHRRTPLREGMQLRIPDPGEVFVAPGDTLVGIAKDHGCRAEDLARLNRLRRGRPLRIGQRLLLPGFEPAAERAKAAERWGRPRRPGVVRLYRRHVGRRILRLLDSRRRLTRRGMRRLRQLMRSRPSQGGRLGPKPPERLARLLARVSDHFGGRRITIVSGYRTEGGYTRENSQHIRGHALDLRVQGVPNSVLRDYLRRTFKRVGVGYYPRSRFVHVDVRDKSSYWVDWSRPGQAPRYQRRGQPAPADATAAEVRLTGMGGLRRRARAATADDRAEPDTGAPGDDRPKAPSTDEPSPDRLAQERRAETPPPVREAAPAPLPPDTDG